MGLSDIDEDEPVTHSPKPPVTNSKTPLQQTATDDGATVATTAAAADHPSTDPHHYNATGGTTLLDDLFGSFNAGASVGSTRMAVSPAPISAPSPSVFKAVTSTAAPTAAPSALDALFAAPVVGPAGRSDTRDSKDEGRAMLYVDGSSGGGVEDDGTNLFDISKPIKKDKYNSAESFLEAFERQGKKGGDRGIERDTLAHLTRNRDDNKVRARLLALMNYYDVLGVAPTASEEEIKRSYKKKALELHPDRVGRDQTQEEAELFKVITKANEVLTDAELRRKYDESLTFNPADALAAPSAADWWNHMQS